MSPQLIPFIPLLLVVATAGVVLVAGLFRRESDEIPIAGLTVIGVTAALIASVVLWNRPIETAGAVTFDVYALFFNVVLGVLALFTLATSPGVVTRGPALPAVALRQALWLLALAAMMAAAAAHDLAIAFLAIDVAWVSTLLLVAAGQDDEAATEAAFKTLILGAFSGACLLYGVALMYVVTGATRLDAVATRIAASSLDPHILMLVSMVLLLVGFGFVISAVPFHMWTADTSSGADARTTGFITTGLRVAGFAVFLRVWLTGLEALRAEWLPVLSAIAGVTMIVGAVAAMGQSNVRRLVAYVGVAHTGYLIMGLVSASQAGKAAVLVSLVAWGAANVGAFAVLAAVSRADRPHEEVRDFIGFGYTRPGAAAVLTICLLSLAGLPLTAGFIGRWLVFSAALQEGLVALVVLGALTSVVVTSACLRLVVQMYMTAPAGPARRPEVAGAAMAGLVAAAVLLVGIGLWPAPLVAAAMRSVVAIF
jgi:NADH-quinone oxidoreductase subunit N